MILVIPDVTFYEFWRTRGRNGSIYWWSDNIYTYLAYIDAPMVTGITIQAGTFTSSSRQPTLIGIRLVSAETSSLSQHLRKHLDVNGGLRLDSNGGYARHDQYEDRYQNVRICVDRQTRESHGPEGRKPLCIRALLANNAIATFFIGDRDALFLAEHLEGVHPVNRPYDERRRASKAY